MLAKLIKFNYRNLRESENKIFSSKEIAKLNGKTFVNLIKKKNMENLSMDTSPVAMELNIPDFDRIYHSAPETIARPSVIKSRKKFTYDINNNKNIFTEVTNNNDKNFQSTDAISDCTCQSFDSAPVSTHSENWYVPGSIRNNNYKNFPTNNFTYENSFLNNNTPNMAASSSNFLYNNNNNNDQKSKSPRNVNRSESLDSIPPLEDAPSTVKVQVGIDDDLQMILDLDPSIVDLGSTPTITITDQTVTGLPPITGG